MNDINLQTINLENRKNLKLTGVTKIETLNPLEFLITTTLGNLCIKGSELEMLAFDVEKGSMHITGTVDSITYFNKSAKKNTKKGFIQKLFK